MFIKFFIGLVLIILLFKLLYKYSPFIDITSTKDILIWFNYKGKRIYKYLYKNEEKNL